MGKQRSVYIDCFLLLIVLVVALYPLVFGLAVMKWDAMDLYLPWKYFVTDTLSHNQLPLWNPFINGGFSQMGDPGTWYPVSWGIAAIFGSYSMGALHFEYLIHLYIGGLGFYFLLKEYGLARIALISCAAGYMLSGIMIGNAQHIGWVVSAAWLPWVILYFVRMQRTPLFKTSVQLALVLFLMLSGGYPGMFIVTAYILIGFFLVNSWQRYQKKEFELYRKQWVYFALSALFFFGMSSVVLVAAFDMAPHITRGIGLNDRSDVWNTLVGSLSPQALTSHVYPLATTKNDQAFWGADFSMTNCYFGVLLLVTIFFSIFRINASKKSRTFFGLGILFILISLGEALPVRTWTTYLPFMDLFRFPSLFRLFALFFFLLSAGFSLNHILSSDKLRLQFRWTILILSGVFLLVTAILFFSVEKYKYLQIFSIGWLHFMEQANIRELIFLQSGILGGLFFSFFLIRKFNWISWKNTFLLIFLFELISFTWMNEYATVLYDRSLKEASVGMDTLPDGFPTPSTTLPISTFNDVDQSTHFVQLWKNLSIYFKRPTYDGISPYAYTNMAKAIETGEYDRLTNYPVVFFAEQLTNQQYIDTASIDTLSGQKMWIETFSPNQLKVNVAVPHETFFVYLQNHYPGWKVKRNASSQRIIKVSETFMALKIPRGKSSIEFTFEPKNVIRASFVSISVWAGALLYLLLSSLIVFRKRIRD